MTGFNLAIDGLRYIRASDGVYTNYGCFEKVYTSPGEIDVHQCCHPVDNKEDEWFYEGAFVKMLGINDLDDLKNDEANLSAASAFSQNLVALETLLDGKGEVDLEKAFGYYKGAASARLELIDSIGPLNVSPRWNEANQKLFEVLKDHCLDARGQVLSNISDGLKSKVRTFSKLCEKSGGPEKVTLELYRIRWEFASDREKMDICGSEDCQSRYEDSAQKEGNALLYRYSVTAGEPYLPSNHRNKDILGLGMGLGVNIEDDRLPLPMASLWLSIRPMSWLTLLGMADFRPDYDDKTTLIVTGVEKQGEQRSGINIGLGGAVAISPFGRGVGFFVGGLSNRFEGKIERYRQLTGDEIKYRISREQETEQSEDFWTGLNVYLRESLRMVLDLRVPTENVYETMAGLNFIYHHSFL